MIAFTCPGCQSKLRGKASLAGQRRNCPKCGTVVEIPGEIPQETAVSSSESPPGELPTPEPHAPDAPHRAGALPHAPERLDRHSHYLICSPSQLVAVWENNGRGWQIKLAGGLVSAGRNRDKLPTEGDFRLVELQLQTTDAGHRLEHIRSYRLARRWALSNLAKGDDEILRAVTGPGCLSRDQKNLLRGAIKERFMREVWQDAQDVLEYLGNTDYHSPGA